MRLEAVSALGGFHDARTRADGHAARHLVRSHSGDPRRGALGAAASLDPEGFVAVLSGLDPDPHWSVRAALASVLGTLPPGLAVARLTSMLGDPDQRAVPSVLAALVKLHAPNAATVLLDRLKADDPVVRAAAANGVGELKPANGPQALAEAYRFGDRDATYTARAAALAALAQYGCGDREGRACGRAGRQGLGGARARGRAAQAARSVERRSTRRSVPRRRGWRPTRIRRRGSSALPFRPQLYIDTDRGTIQIELAVLDAPLTVDNFVALARKGFFNGLSIHRVVPDFVIQDGDPRGDGEGGPGYTIRDELNERPYLRGTVGMALDWADTGGSQFFITHSPQPHLDAKYTVFGRVVAGMEVVDEIQQWDVIRRVRVWDGQQMTER